MHLEELASNVVVYVDDSRACVSIAGEDAHAWLGGMVTCDVAPLGKEGVAVYGCALDVKGKIEADLVAVRRGDAIDLFVPARVADDLAAKWDRFIVMEDVEVARVDRVLVELHGARAIELAREAGLGERASAIDLLGAGGCVIDAAREEAIVNRLEKAGARVIDKEVMGALHVEAARATFGRDLDETHYVQEGGLEARAVSFSKGCYVGQEVVCMLQMRGKVHRKLVQLRVDRAPAAGAKVALDGKEVGAVTSVAPREDGSALALAMVKATAAEVGKALDVEGARAVVTMEAR